MKKLLPVALLLPLFTGCTSLGWIESVIGIKPAATPYGPFSEERRLIWDVCREVLADEGYTFANIKRDEWEMETRWFSYGSDFRFENHRYRITITLEDDDNPRWTKVMILAEHERNSGENPLDASEDAWSAEGADEDVQDLLAYKIKTNINRKRDIYTETYRRLDAEDRRKAPPPDYGDTNR